MSSRIEKDHARWLSALHRAAGWAGDPAAYGAKAGEISGWSVGQHLEHLLLADRGICGGLMGAARDDEIPEAEATGRPSWMGRVVLLTGFIPRGKGRAPDRTVPTGASREEVEAGFAELIGEALRLAGSLDRIRRSSFRVRHPVLGAFTAAQWLRFAWIHHAHHEKIIRELLGDRS